MKINRSPWIHQLDRERKPQKLSSDITTDVVIVGAGIAGISTAFFILKYTDKKVVVVDKGKLAHGATGHNAGQIASYFERPFHEIVEEFGLKMACEGQTAVEDAWELLDEAYTEAKLSVPLSRFIGHAGFSSFDQVMRHLKDNYERKRGGIKTEQFRISDSAPFLNSIPEQYSDLYETVPHNEVLKCLETDRMEYIAALSYQKGCLNSALFCQELVNFLLSRYPDRFSLYEHTPVIKVVLHKNKALLDAFKNTLTCSRVVLCTNGFENLTIINESGLDIDTKFHHYVRGMVGFMSGYVEKMNKSPIAISYFPPENKAASDPYLEDPYFYLTRRAYDYEGTSGYNLISIGGPEFPLESRHEYTTEFDYPDDIQEDIDSFVKSTYDTEPNKKIDYQFTWHGLMGYTPSGVRVVGSEPKNPTLLYNLGCNGVGILPSIHGARRISRIIAGEKLPPSIFDPRSS